MLRLRDLVELPELGIAVAAGEDALDREVRWVSASELADPSPDLRPGDLLLTRGLAPVAETSAAATAYVERLLQAGASGLLFGLRAERPAVPAALRDACRAAGLPCLVLAADVSFAVVSEEMAKLLGAQREHAMAQRLARGTALLQALADGGDASDVLRILARDHGLPVALVDHAGRVLGSADLRLSWRDRRPLTAAMKGPSHADVQLHDGTSCAIFPVIGVGTVKALLVCARPVVELSGDERSALQQAARFLALELTRRQALAAIESRFAGEILEMLYDTARLTNELPGRLRSFSIDPYGPLVVVSVALARPEPPVVPGLAETISRFWLAQGASVVVLETDEDTVAILSWSRGATDLVAAAGLLAEELSREFGVAARPMLGIGRINVGAPSLPRSLLEAREARRSAQRRRNGPPVVRFERAGSHRMLLALHERPALDGFADAVLGPLRAYDQKRDANLETTLRTFLYQGCRWNVTAEILHMHVNTLRNRLARIETLLDRDLDRTEDRVDLFLALAVGDHDDGRS